MNGDPFYVTGQWLKPTLFDQGAKYGKSAIPICWATNYNPKEITKASIDVQWIEDVSLIVNIGKVKSWKGISQAELEAVKSNISYPPDWDDYVTEYKEEPNF
jgi:hypothetical protein